MGWRGGVIFTPEGYLETNFAWGLGSKTNNMVEALAHCGDSRIIIQAMAENSPPNQMHLKHLIKKIKILSLSFLKIDFFHVLRKNNKEVDRAANLGSTLSFSTLIINGINSLCVPP